MAIMPALLLSLAAGGARAATPSASVIPIDDSHVSASLSAACGFPVTVTDQGTVRDTLFVDKSGTATEETLHFQSFRITFSGNGSSFTSESPDSVDFNLVNGDTTTHGLQLRIAVPGQGLIGIQAGTFVVDAGGNLIFSAGPVIPDPLSASVCAAL
jgi:hypothetical protein